MNYYDMFGVKIRTKLDFSDFLYPSMTKSYDFEIVHENVFAGDILKSSEILYRRFIYGEAIPFEEFFKVDGKYYLLRWLSQYNFFIDPEKRLLTIDGKLDGEFFCVFFSRILSFLLYLKGYSQLHGSAVRYQDKTVCFIGKSGSGKSTSASLCVKNGGKIITDDIIAFHPKDHKLRSGLPSLRLFSSSPLVKMAKQCFDEVDKLRVDFSNGLHYTETSAINAFFFLEVNDEKGLFFKRLKGNETILHLISNVYGKYFLKNVFSEFLHAKNVPIFSRFSNEIPMFKVYRHSNTKPDELFELIHTLVSNLD